MPGVGGKALSEEHATRSATVLNRIKPDSIRVRTIGLPPKSPIKRLEEKGSFTQLSDEEIMGEIQIMIEELDNLTTHFRCQDFSLNLIPSVDGYLNKDKE